MTLVVCKGPHQWDTWLVSVLSVHHLAEDEVAFPDLRGKLPDAPFDELMAEHWAMEEILEELQAIAEAVAAEAEAGGSLNDLNRPGDPLCAL